MPRFSFLLFVFSLTMKRNIVLHIWGGGNCSAPSDHLQFPARRSVSPRHSARGTWSRSSWPRPCQLTQLLLCYLSRCKPSPNTWEEVFKSGRLVKSNAFHQILALRRNSMLLNGTWCGDRGGTSCQSLTILLITKSTHLM